ncbi:rod shape-determining protein MreC [Candidatus Microgenomates bacterium]|nr:rod shape-determining protein MreC [Candidatus Microgenomates bacterium]
MDNTSFQKTLQRFILFFIFSALLMLFDWFGLLTLPKQGFYTIASPLEIGLYSFSQTAVEQFSFLTFWKNGYREIEYLKQRNRELSVETARVRQLLEENESLKKQFAALGQESQALLPARVVSFSRYLLVDKGTKDHVAKGQMVMFDKILVGRVVEVGQHWAKVILPNDPEEKIIVITTKNRAKGVLKGSFNQDLILDQILQKEKIEPEETIETAGGDNFQKGILIGRITQVGGKKSDVFQSARAESLLEFNKLTDVFIKIK